MLHFFKLLICLYKRSKYTVFLFQQNLRFVILQNKPSLHYNDQIRIQDRVHAVLKTNKQHASSGYPPNLFLYMTAFQKLIFLSSLRPRSPTFHPDLPCKHSRQIWRQRATQVFKYFKYTGTWVWKVLRVEFKDIPSPGSCHWVLPQEGSQEHGNGASVCGTALQCSPNPVLLLLSKPSWHCSQSLSLCFVSLPYLFSHHFCFYRLAVGSTFITASGHICNRTFRFSLIWAIPNKIVCTGLGIVLTHTVQ